MAAAMKYCVEHLRMVVEGGGAVGIAALLSVAWGQDRLANGPIVVIVSGGNVSADPLRRLLDWGVLCTDVLGHRMWVSSPPPLGYVRCRL